ncbi:MAG: CHAD domain-containing protein [Planctomycetes bacterium]|nr:CHAD domain-containing protein [Planctomycetota bacterium]
MSVDNKWIDGLDKTMTVAGAARKVLQARLESVRDRLAPALHHAEEDVEHVHQLRVSTRRAGAALRIFASTLPDKTLDRLRKALRRLRRAAGAARDWDVFLLELVKRNSRAPARSKPGLDFLIGLAHGQRMLAQDELADAAQNPKIELGRLVPEALSEIRDSIESAGSALINTLSRAMLRELLAELHQAAAENLHDYEHLHQVRICGKNLRYAMEVFGSCFPERFRTEFYPAVESMQDTLGLANDSQVASQRLQKIKDRLQTTDAKLWRRCQPGIDALLKFHDKRLPRQREAFLKWWAAWKASGMESRFLRLLNA